MRATWRMLAGRRDLRLVLAAGLISMSGDWILTIGLIYRVYVLTGSTVASALTMASSFAPQVLLGAVAGVFADRWDRKRTMIAADLLLAAGLLPLLLVRRRRAGLDRLRGHVRRGLPSSSSSTPLEQAMVPRLVRPRRTADGQRGQRSGLERGPAGGFGARRHHRRGRRHRRGDTRRRGQLPRLRRPAGAGRGERTHGLSRVARRTDGGQAGPGRRGTAPMACGGRRGTGCCGC